jgi:iron complex outermembrane receptor protein
VEFAASSAIVVADASPFAISTYGTDRTAGYGVWNAEAGYDWRLADSDLRGFARVDNLFDKTYVGSVLVNEGNGRYFESAPGRSLMAGLQWRWR